MSGDERTARRRFLELTSAAMAGAVARELTPAAAARASASSTTAWDIRAFGAKGDGRTLDTTAINRAIEAAARSGGGVVSFPAGSYLSYSIRLNSNVTLSLGPGASIVAADPPSPGSAGYDPAEPNAWDMYQDFGHSHWHNSLIWGENIENFSILGPGRIWGKGLSRGGGDGVLPPGVGNKAISLKNCHNVTLRDFSVLHGGHFAILATGVDNLTIDNLLIDTNRDAIDVDCCRNVRISNCSVNSPWDDGICLKNSYGLGWARPTEHVTVSNCYVTGGYEEGTLLDGTYKHLPPDSPAARNGRIKLGTESNGGFRNIAISNCVIDDCRGIALESVDGALLEDVSISNITMRDIVDVPLFLRLGSRMRGPAGTTVGELRRVNISNLVASNCASRQASIITGIPGHCIEDVRLSNIIVLHRGGGTKEDAMMQPPEIENVYPEPDRFGPMPSHAFFIRHVKNISMRDVEVKYASNDLRPAMRLDDVHGADFTHLQAAHAPDVPTFVLNNVENFNLYQSPPLADTQIDRAQQKTL